jgi:hypothetical protein
MLMSNSDARSTHAPHNNSAQQHARSHRRNTRPAAKHQVLLDLALVDHPRRRSDARIPLHMAGLTHPVRLG